MTRGRRELWLVLTAMALAIAVRLAFVWATKDHTLAGDEVEYDSSARLAAQGMWFWSEALFGVPHESFQKAPGYPAWVSLWYSVLGPGVDKVLALQALAAPVTVGLTWQLGRRLFTPGVGVGAAFVAALAPSVWQYDVRLYSEWLATPLSLLVLLLVLDRGVTPRRAAGVGALMGVNLLVRPSAVLLFAGVLVAWWVVAGWRRGTLLTALAVAVAALVVAPWTLRNLSVDPDHLVPISVQDAALYGTFNDDAANDPDLPYKWRPVPARERALFSGPPLSDGALRAELRSRALDYIAEHPDSVPKAFFWNGVVRLWDLRPPGEVIDAAPFEGRPRWIAAVSLACYWIMLPLAVAGLWLARRRRALVLPLLAVALASSVVYTADAGTRYRAPLEPVIVVLAGSAVAAGLAGVRRRRTIPGPAPAAAASS